MSRMQQIETSVGEGHPQALLAPLLGKSGHTVTREELVRIRVAVVGPQRRHQLAGRRNGSTAFSNHDTGSDVGECARLNDRAPSRDTRSHCRDHRIASSRYVENFPRRRAQMINLSVSLNDGHSVLTTGDHHRLANPIAEDFARALHDSIIGSAFETAGNLQLAAIRGEYRDSPVLGE